MRARTTTSRLAAALAAAALALGACGGGSSSSGSEGSGGSDGGVAVFCEMSAAFEASAKEGDFEFPPAEELEAAVDAAPAEIRSEMRTLVDAFGRLEEGDLSVVQEPEVQEASDAVAAFEAEHCGTGGAPSDSAPTREPSGIEDDLPEGAGE